MTQERQTKGSAIYARAAAMSESSPGGRNFYELALNEGIELTICEWNGEIGIAFHADKNSEGVGWIMTYPDVDSALEAVRPAIEAVHAVALAAVEAEGEE